MFDDAQIPGTPRYNLATPLDELSLQLQGGQRYDSVTFTHQQVALLREFYDPNNESIRERVELSRQQHAEAVKQQAARQEELRKQPWAPALPNVPPFDEDTVRGFFEAGDDLALLRRVAREGLRIMGFLARYLEPDEDPVKLVARLVIDAGYDVDATVVSWVGGEETEVED